MIEHVRKVLADIKRVAPEYDPKQGYELAGFVWFQGFNDMINDWTYDDGDQPGGYALYTKLLALFIRDVRKDLSAPKMPFVIGVMGIDGMKRRNRACSISARLRSGRRCFPSSKATWWRCRRRPSGTTIWPHCSAGGKERETYAGGAETPEGGVSNGGYHYLGAAKIMAPIGKAFAEALLDLQKTQGQAK